MTQPSRTLVGSLVRLLPSRMHVGCYGSSYLRVLVAC
jgi:hypothetical protein